jgi:hypothetical protein
MKRVDGNDIKKMMIRAGWMHPLDNPLMLPMDRSFQPADEQEVWKIIEADSTDQKPYVPEKFDCDNFAFGLVHAFSGLGWAVGVLIVETSADPNNPGKVGYHAIFFYCTKEGRIEAVEPQNDSPFNKPFKVRSVIMY